MRYLLPNTVVDYIEQHGLYQDETTPNVSSTDKEKGKEKEAGTSASGSKNS